MSGVGRPRPRTRSAITARAATATLITATAVFALLATGSDSAATGEAQLPLTGTTVAEPQEADVRRAVEAFVPEPTPAVPPVVLAPPPVASPVVVADARPGDLRTDPNADALPIDYRPAPPALEILDVAYGLDPAQRLDIRLPAGADAPVIVYLHSGGWVGGGREFVPDMVLRFVDRGYAVVSVGYRLAPAHPFPEPIEDVKRAIRWVKVYGDRTGTIDGDRIVLVGASAGGHLASFTAATAGLFEPGDLTVEESAVDSTVAGVVSMVGPTDLVELYRHDHMWALPLTAAFVGCDPCTDGRLAAASPGSYLHDQLPPAYWAYGSLDSLVGAVEQGETIAEAWAAEAGAGMSWIDVIEVAGHNLDESTVNLRQLDIFVDAAVGLG